MTKVAVLDDTQALALDAAPWDQLRARGVTVDVFRDPFASEDAAARALAGFDVLVPMRERTAFPASLLARLTSLRLIALTGARAPTLDVAACTARGVLVCNTGGGDLTSASTSELTWALLLARRPARAAGGRADARGRVARRPAGRADAGRQTAGCGRPRPAGHARRALRAGLRHGGGGLEPEPHGGGGRRSGRQARGEGGALRDGGRRHPAPRAVRANPRPRRRGRVRRHEAPAPSS